MLRPNCNEVPELLPLLMMYHIVHGDMPVGTVPT